MALELSEKKLEAWLAERVRVMRRLRIVELELGGVRIVLAEARTRRVKT